MNNSYIHLIRHGQTEGNVKRWYYGSSDIALTKEGVGQITALAKAGIYPKGENADMYTSGLLRTEQTFFLIYGGAEHGRLMELREIAFGEFEMKSHEDLSKDLSYNNWIEDKTGCARPPLGESRVDFAQRVQRGFKKLIDYHSLKELSMRHGVESVNSIVVCHGGVISCIMAEAFNEDKHFYQWIPDPGHGYTLTMEDGAPVAYRAF